AKWHRRNGGSAFESLKTFCDPGGKSLGAVVDKKTGELKTLRSEAWHEDRRLRAEKAERERDAQLRAEKAHPRSVDAIAAEAGLSEKLAKLRGRGAPDPDAAEREAAQAGRIVW